MRQLPLASFDPTVIRLNRRVSRSLARSREITFDRSTTSASRRNEIDKQTEKEDNFAEIGYGRGFESIGDNRGIVATRKFKDLKAKVIEFSRKTCYIFFELREDLNLKIDRFKKRREYFRVYSDS